MLAALTVAALGLSLATASGTLSAGPLWALGALSLAAVAWPARTRARDDALPALAFVLAGFGLAIIARLSPELAHRQEAWIGVSLAILAACAIRGDAVRALARYKYVWVLAALAAFVFVSIFGEEINGAKLWIRIGTVQFEPVELIKLFIVFFMASYLAETADVIAAAKPWSLRANAKYLGPLVIGWGSSLLILILERDLGMAIMLFGIFAMMLYVATRRIDLVVGSGVVLSLAIVYAAHRYAYVAARIGVWLHPFADPLGRGYQAVQALYAVAAGGWFGTGYGLGHPRYIPEVATDYIHAALSEEFGLVGAIVLLAAYYLIVTRALAIAREQSDLYLKLLATGIAAAFACQVFTIVGGVLGLLPLTGITLPFVSYGGSSLVSNFFAIGVLWAISDLGAARAPAASEDRA